MIPKYRFKFFRERLELACPSNLGRDKTELYCVLAIVFGELSMGKITTGVVFISRFKLIPSKRQEFLDAHRSETANAADFLDKYANFFFFGFGRNENEWVSIESWKDEEAVDQLRASPAFKQIAKRMLDCLSAPAEISVYAGEDGPLTALDKYPIGLSKVHPHDAAMPVKYV